MSSNGFEHDSLTSSYKYEYASIDLRLLYQVMQTTRFVDLVESELVAGGEAFLHVPTRGHEGVAVLNHHLRPSDWIHAHYRDKALLLARGVGVAAYFHSIFCNACSSSAGRHMSEFMSSPELRILSGVVPVGNHALQSVGIATRLVREPCGSIVVCSMGDGTTQQGEVYEAIAESVRENLPVLFWIEDNDYAISTTTRNRTFYSLPGDGPQPENFMGVKIHHVNGRDVVGANKQLGPIITEMRHTQAPAIVIFHVDRLSSHTNSDDQRTYRDAEECDKLEELGDPVHNLERWMIGTGVSPIELKHIADQAEEHVRREAEVAKSVPDPETTTESKRPLPQSLVEAKEYRGSLDAQDRMTMLESMRSVLKQRLGSDPRVQLLGQDIEDPKGDVFGVTRGLSTEFPNRVKNSALSEATIIGSSIGQSLTGIRPVAFIQFSDFIYPAFNQIISEMSTMYWRTNGQWESPVIIMVACGGYRPGLGPFHSQTNEALMAHIPGLDVFMPSDAGDAAGLLNAAFKSNRPTIFFYPKICLNDPDRSTSSDTDKQIVVPGKARRVKSGNDLTLVSWGSTMPICEKAVTELEAEGITVDLFDLRSISPWDQEAILKSAETTSRLVVVHEDNHSCGFAGEIISSVTESTNKHIQCRRVTRPDTLLPSNYVNHLDLLPSVERVLVASAELLEMEFGYEDSAEQLTDILTVEATGSSPADQSITVVQWNVKPGDRVTSGQNIAEMDADKAIFDLAAPRDGVVAEILVEEAETVRIGTPILRLRVADAAVAAGTNETRKLVLKKRNTEPRKAAEEPSIIRLLDHVNVADPKETVGLSPIYTSLGSQMLTNDKLAGMFPGRTNEDIIRRTGISSRPCVDQNENVLTLAVKSARQGLEREGMTIHDIDAIICSTTTPISITPSVACQVLHELNDPSNPREIPAYDMNAACAGYVYALSNGFDFLVSNPQSTVMVLTTEAMSQISSPEDFDTAILFGDAASVTFLRGSAHNVPSAYQLHRPIISAKGESGEMLGTDDNGFIHMNGKRVFTEAVRQMTKVLDRICLQVGMEHGELEQIVPHQANGRIIEAIRRRMQVDEEKMFNNIAQMGNTSSSSIPLALAEMMASRIPNTIGLTAFGAGYTFGAAILSHPNEEVLRRNVA